jgi:hypothetical protein
MNNSYRVSYSKLSAVPNMDAGLGSVSWDQTNMYLSKSDGISIAFPFASLAVSTQKGGKPIREMGKTESNFCLTDTTAGAQYNISFIGSQEGSVLGVNQDYKEHAKTFVSFVVKSGLTKDKNFKADGTYDHRTSNLVLVLALVGFVVLCGLIVLFTR